MTISERVLGLVVGPAAGEQAPGFAPPAPSHTPIRAAVLTERADAGAAAAAVALAAMRRERRSCALAVSWGGVGDEPPPAGALPAAGRLAARLKTAGFDAVAAGHLVRVKLGGDGRRAADGWSALCREEVPAAIAVAGPRGAALDRALAAADAIVVVTGRDTPEGLVAAARADASEIGPPVAVADMRLGTAMRGLLALGYGVPPRIKAAIDEALR